MGRVVEFPTFQGKNIKRTRPYIIMGWIFAITSLFFLPILFGILGIIMGFITEV